MTIFTQYTRKAAAILMALPLLVALPVGIHAAPGVQALHSEEFSSVDKPTRDFYRHISAIDVLQANFEQTIIDHEGHSSAPSAGVMKLKRPNKVFWQTLPPQEQLVVSNGEKLWVYDPDLEQATMYSGGRALQGPMTLLAKSAEALAKDFIVTQRATKKTTTFELSPRPKASTEVSQDAAFSRLSFVFKKDVLVEISMSDKLRQVTTISLAKVKLNSALDDAVFDFIVPDGVDVVINE